MFGSKRKYQVTRTREEVASVIEAFLAGSGGEWDWDDFISISMADPDLERIRERCSGLPVEFPSTDRGHYCGSKGFETLRAIARRLRDEVNE